MVRLSIVLITKNQAWNVRRLVNSVHRACAGEPTYEIALIDSASDDDTLKIASELGIGVVRLAKDQRLTAAAGRFVGYNVTCGKHVLFLDGDMELADGWLPKALDLLRADSTVAAVTGEVLDLQISDDTQNQPADPDQQGKTEVPFTGGAALYRRDVMQEVGPFNPALFSDEEPDLGVRIRHAGYRILCTKQRIAYHYTMPPDSIGGMRARWKRNLYLGFGQNIRHHFGEPTFWMYVRERGFAIAPAMVFGLATASIITWLITGINWYLFAPFFLFTAAFLAALVKKRSVRAVIEMLFHRTLILFGTMKGLTTRVDTHPAHIEFEVVREVVPIVPTGS